MDAFDRAFRVERFDSAEYFAGQLFAESFGTAFPVPRDRCGLSIPTPRENWHQYVAFYKWSDSAIEAVGFCNWIRYDDVYLEGGMCVRRSFYRRLPAAQFAALRDRGGVAQLMMETAARRLNDCPAWFGYCGDRKASIVDARVGFVPTGYRHLIVKWFADLPAAEQQHLIEKIAAIGAF